MENLPQNVRNLKHSKLFVVLPENLIPKLTIKVEVVHVKGEKELLRFLAEKPVALNKKYLFRYVDKEDPVLAIGNRRKPYPGEKGKMQWAVIAFKEPIRQALKQFKAINPLPQKSEVEVLDLPGNERDKEQQDLLVNLQLLSWAETPTNAGEFIDGTLRQICEYDLEEKQLEQGRFLLHSIIRSRRNEKFGAPNKYNEAESDAPDSE